MAEAGLLVLDGRDLTIPRAPDVVKVVRGVKVREMAEKFLWNGRHGWGYYWPVFPVTQWQDRLAVPQKKGLS